MNSDDIRSLQGDTIAVNEAARIGYLKATVLQEAFLADGDRQAAAFFALLAGLFLAIGTSLHRVARAQSITEGMGKVTESIEILSLLARSLATTGEEHEDAVNLLAQTIRGMGVDFPLPGT